MIRAYPFPFVAALALSAAAAQADLATGVQYVSGPADAIEVAFQPGAGPADYWCAAGEYAARTLGLAGGDRLWRLSEPPRAPGEGLRFSSSPAGAASRTGLIVSGGDDASLPVDHARQFCSNWRED